MNKRNIFRAKLDPLYLPHYDALCAELPAHWQPYCGYRSPEEQAKLSPKSTRAKAWESPHNWGMASDWTVCEDGIFRWPDPSDKIWDEYEQALEKVGLAWGGDWHGFADCPHNQLALRVSYKKIGQIYLAEGLEKAYSLIRENLAT
jgi:hypothetical protein